MTPITDFIAGRTRFECSEPSRRFAHQYDRDLHIFVIWSNGRVREAEVVHRISAELRVLHVFEIGWSASRAIQNLDRLYGRREGYSAGKLKEVGGGPFLVLVVEERRGEYAYRRNVSGRVELTNITIAKVKEAARELSGGGYLIHSSNSLDEFFRDAALLLGVKRLAKILEDNDPSPSSVEALEVDLAGADGWPDLQTLFRTLRYTTPYVVLRDFDALKERPNPGKDVDVLAGSVRSLTSAANALRVGSRPDAAGYRTTIRGKPLKLDVRAIGDGYFDARWQEQVLERSVFNEHGVRVPRADDHFFTLLYHTLLQKPAVSRERDIELRQVGAAIGLPAHEFEAEDFKLRTLDGYLAARRYDLPRPFDSGVPTNITAWKRIERSSLRPSDINHPRHRYHGLRSRAARVPGLRTTYRFLRSRLPKRSRE